MTQTTMENEMVETTEPEFNPIRDIEVMKGGSKVRSKGRNRTAWEYLGVMHKKYSEILKGGDLSAASHAREMIALMHVAAGEGNLPMPDDIIEVEG